MNFDELMSQIPILETNLYYHCQTPLLLASAFVHRSYLNENKEVPVVHNERLEFLGDSVLNLIVGEYLFRHLPERPEGELSSIRAHAVSSTACMQYITALDVQKFILVGKGEKMQAGKGRSSILSDTFEAILAAIYLDGGLESARSFFLFHFASKLEEMCKTPSHNFKALLQEHVQKELHLMPQYRILDESGPDHNRLFVVGVFLDEKLIGTGKGFTKKEAEQEAASLALLKIAPQLLES